MDNKQALEIAEGDEWEIRVEKDHFQCDCGKNHTVIRNSYMTPIKITAAHPDKVDAIEGKARTMQRIEICPGVEVYMTQEQLIVWNSRPRMDAVEGEKDEATMADENLEVALKAVHSCVREFGTAGQEIAMGIIIESAKQYAARMDEVGE